MQQYHDADASVEIARWDDLIMTLACLNIQLPHKRGLQRKLNTVIDKVEDMNKEQIIQNQQYVRRIQTFAGLPVEVT